MFTPENQTKSHFGELCNAVFAKVIEDYEVPKSQYKEALGFIASLCVHSWNILISIPSLKDAKAGLLSIFEPLYDDLERIKKIIGYAIELKWREYRSDCNLISGVEIKKVNGSYWAEASLIQDDPITSKIMDKITQVVSNEKIAELIADTPPDELFEKLQSLVSSQLKDLLPDIQNVQIQAICIPQHTEKTTPDLPPEAIFYLRKSMKLTQAKFAELFHTVPRQISLWEHGKAKPDEAQKAQIRKLWKE